MNKAEYMKCLEHRLRRLPKEDYNKAIEYFEEYFEEAGPEQESQAIEDLGRPEMAADQIIRDFAVENADQPTRNVKKGFSAIWVGVLAIFAAPIGLPLALAFGIVALAFIVVVIAVIFAILCTAVTLGASSIPCIFISFWFMFTSPANGVATLGMGLMGIGVGIWVVMGCIALCKWFLNAMTKIFAKIARGGRRHEK